MNNYFYNREQPVSHSTIRVSRTRCIAYVVPLIP